MKEARIRTVRHLVDSGFHTLPEGKAEELANSCEYVFWPNDHVEGASTNARLTERSPSPKRSRSQKRSRSPMWRASASSDDKNTLENMSKDIAHHIKLTSTWQKKANDWSEEIGRERNRLFNLQGLLSDIVFNQIGMAEEINRRRIELADVKEQLRIITANMNPPPDAKKNDVN